MAGLVLYVFRDQVPDIPYDPERTPPWTIYYYFLNKYLIILTCLAAVCGLRTRKDRIMACFMILLNILLLIYYIYCLINKHTPKNIEGYMVFFITLAVAGFMSVLLKKHYINHEKL